MKLVCKAFEHLLFTWNSGIDLPKKLPVSLRYQFTVDTFNQGIAIVNSGLMTFDYCSCYAPDCIFKEYCPAWKFGIKRKMMIWKLPTFLMMNCLFNFKNTWADSFITLLYKTILHAGILL